MSMFFSMPWRRRRRVSAPVLFLFTFGGMAATVFCLIQWNTARNEISAFTSAPLCGQGQLYTNCILEFPVTVLGTRSFHSRSGTSYYITIQGGAAAPFEVQVGDANGGWIDPPAGTQMEAIYWHRRIVTLTGPGMPDIKTTNNPISRTEMWRNDAFLAMAFAVIPMLVVIFRVLRGDSSGSGPGLNPAGPAPYEFSHVDT